MLAELRLNTFQEKLNTTFRVANPACVLTLTQVDVHNQTSRHESFSLFFVGPAAPFLPQATYELSQDDGAETVAVFLVPVARVKDGFQYEAVFNHVF